MPETEKTIRDFLYLDVDRLYSLTSQLEGGLLDRLTQSSGSNKASRDVHRTALKGEESGTEVASTLETIESRIVHDDLYSKLEAHLANSIRNIEATTGSITPELINALLIKVNGRAIVEDFDRMLQQVSSWKQITGAFAYITKDENPSYQAALNTFINRQNEIGTILSGSVQVPERKRLQEEAKKIATALQGDSIFESVMQQSTTSVDSRVMQSWQTIIEFFMSGEYVISLMKSNDEHQLEIRAVLNKNWLRMSPDYIRHAYGNNFIQNVIVVGQVTSFSEPDSETDKYTSQKFDGLREAMSDLFGMMRNVDRTTTTAGSRPVLFVRPLAIYQEYKIPAAP